jgi:serine-type D-Ala-D-Ala carboxypeptidase/endopeptidase (penicillin-binding protein 4)
VRPTVVVGIVAALAAAVGLAVSSPAEAATSLRARLHAALAGFDGRGTGALAVDLTSGRAVYAHNANASLLPASNQKLALTYAALVVLGPSFRTRTEVLGEGKLEGDATWRGNLILKGYGDPTLDRAGLIELARRLRASGIRRVTGSLVADESWFDVVRGGPGWKASFIPVESQPLSALTVAGARGALGVARLFREALGRAGVRVNGGTKIARAGGWPLAVRFSPPLEEILHHMDVESDNFTAELLLKQLGATLAGRGTTAAGAAVVRGVLADRRIPLGGVRIADGSGLSTLDRLTAKALVTILQRMWADRELRPVVFRILPVSGRDGTLADRLAKPPARGNVRAKTGTLDRASALSGFVRERYAFAILQNGRRLSSYAARVAQDRFAAVLAAEHGGSGGLFP